MDFDEFEELLNESLETKPAQELVFSVSDFIATSNQTFATSFPSVLIEGEVSSFKVNQNKFVFFDIKDGNSSLNCFMTIWQLRLPLEDGMKVIVKAQPKLTNWGKFSLTVSQIRPKGEGSLKKSFDILKQKLTKEGLFADARKRTLPSKPQNIAVISSTQAAGYADFIKIINERWGGMNISVAHVQVQGLSAPDQIIRAFDYFNESSILPEVIVLIRGGGSADDLAAFNDEQLVRKIASSKVPVLTGIGHETDESLADYAADCSASTPSNAAQILTPDKKSEFKYLSNRVANLSQNLLLQIENQEDKQKHKLVNLNQLLNNKVDQVQQKIIARQKILESYNPEDVLRRGYAIMSGKIAVGQDLRIETNKKIIQAEVKDVTER